MRKILKKNGMAVTCRTGSLEKDANQSVRLCFVTCRTGSLETKTNTPLLNACVTCRTGSLEIPDFSDKYPLTVTCRTGSLTPSPFLNPVLPSFPRRRESSAALTETAKYPNPKMDSRLRGNDETVRFRTGVLQIR